MKETEMKKSYIAPEIEIVALQTEDVLNQSGPGGFFGDDDSFSVPSKSIRAFE